METIERQIQDGQDTYIVKRNQSGMVSVMSCSVLTGGRTMLSKMGQWSLEDQTVHWLTNYVGVVRSIELPDRMLSKVQQAIDDEIYFLAKSRSVISAKLVGKRGIVTMRNGKAVV